MKNLFILFLFISATMFAISVGQVFAEGDAEVEHGGDIVYTKPVIGVIFSHKAHTEDIGLQCEWCHDSTFEMEALHMQEDANFDMESLCNDAYCGTCHNGDISFSTTVQCARCHIGVKGYNEMVQQGKIKPDHSLEVPAPAAKGH